MKNQICEFPIGKVALVFIPGNKRAQYRWFVREREDGRIIVKTPKLGVQISRLKDQLDADFGPEKLLPKGSVMWDPHKNHV